MKGLSSAKDKPGAPAAFVEDMHRALLLIYEPGRLAKSPLIATFGLHHLPDPALSLRHILVEGIEALKPQDGVPLHGNAWRMYDVLRYRYIVQIPQHEIAASLALSQRHVRRYQQAALDMLANHLITYHALQLSAPTADSTPQPVVGETAGEHPDPARQELERLQASTFSETARLQDILEHVMETVKPALQTWRVRVETTVPDDLPLLAVHMITMRQAMVGILTVAAHAVPKGRIHIRASVEASQVLLRFEAMRGTLTAAPFSRDDSEGLEMARQLVAPSGGRLELDMEAGPQMFSMTVVVPVAQRVSVLVIDDNVDAHQLVRRYLEGTPYAFAGVDDPQQALTTATALAPGAILLDVMLPGMDGWELLGRLREHPITHNTPIIVCTILPQERLALTLGAAAFLRKPFMRPALLAALNALVGPFPGDG